MGMREEFEAWVSTQSWTVDMMYRDGYVGWEAQFAFDAWQASRAALVVTLPATQYYGDSWSGDYALPTEDTHEALTDAGVSYK